MNVCYCCHYEACSLDQCVCSDEPDLGGLGSSRSCAIEELCDFEGIFAFISACLLMYKIKKKEKLLRLASGVK